MKADTIQIGNNCSKKLPHKSKQILRIFGLGSLVNIHQELLLKRVLCSHMLYFPSIEKIISISYPFFSFEVMTPTKNFMSRHKNTFSHSNTTGCALSLPPLVNFTNILEVHLRQFSFANKNLTYTSSTKKA